MADQLCLTDTETHEFSFRWTITNFDVAMATNESLQGPTFTSSRIAALNTDLSNTPIDQCTWRLTLGHRSTWRSPPGNVSLTFAQLTRNYYLEDRRYTKTICRDMPAQQAKFTLSLLNKGGEKEYSKTSLMQELAAGNEVGFSDFIEMKTVLERKDDLLHDNCLKVLCELTIRGTIAHNPVRRIENYLYPDPANDLAAQLGVVLDGPDEGLYSDFTITAGERHFKVHKLLLATRSSVFRAMIDSTMMEGESSCVKIEDHSPEVVKEMLTYIYTGQAPNIKELVEDLLSIAHKYQLDSLVLNCGKELRDRLTPETVILTLRQAEKYAMKPLKRACLRYALDNFSEVEKSQAFSALKTEEPEMYLKLLEAKTLSTVDEDIAPPAKRARN